MPEVRRIGVVVPARDEAGRVGPCLDAIHVAAAFVDVPVQVLVVVNGTSDDTADVARSHGCRVAVIARHGVGHARALGCALLLSDHGVDGTWLATTDADSRVPSGWLVHQLALAADGADAVVGTVRLDPGDEAQHSGWWRHYRDGLSPGRHRHVHGANLAVNASAYRAVGAFADLAAHEDADLVRRLDDAGADVRRTSAWPVVTSARTVGRAEVGVAADLRSWTGRTAG